MRRKLDGSPNQDDLSELMVAAAVVADIVDAEIDIVVVSTAVWTTALTATDTA